MKYTVQVEIKAYRAIEVEAVSVEDAKIKAVEEFASDPYVDDLDSWGAISVSLVTEGNPPYETLWVESR